jgi:flagellar biosynthesis repressor protein FlbT
VSRSIHLGLKSGERLYINGAVIRVDRKVSIELLNDAAFLLEAHVMQADETTTPLRQLYFVVQTMLIDPADDRARAVCREHLDALRSSLETAEILDGLAAADALIADDRLFEALKAIRSLFAAERRILFGTPDCVEPEPRQLRLVNP